MALRLQRHGVLRVRPLVGGIDAWLERKLPTEGSAIADLAQPEPV